LLASWVVGGVFLSQLVFDMAKIDPKKPIQYLDFDSGSPLLVDMRLVTYWRTNRASKTADKNGTFSSFFLAYTALLSVMGDTV
jgi:hypothetical protein